MNGRVPSSMAIYPRRTCGCHITTNSGHDCAMGSALLPTTWKRHRNVLLVSNTQFYLYLESIAILNEDGVIYTSLLAVSAFLIFPQNNSYVGLISSYNTTAPRRRLGTNSLPLYIGCNCKLVALAHHSVHSTAYGHTCPLPVG